MIWLLAERRIRIQDWRSVAVLSATTALATALRSPPELIIICAIIGLIVLIAIVNNNLDGIGRDYPIPASPPGNYAAVQPVSKFQRLGRWKRLLVGGVWVAAFVQPIATLIANASMAVQTVIGFEISAMAAAMALTEVIVRRR